MYFLCKISVTDHYSTEMYAGLKFTAVYTSVTTFPDP